MTELERLEIEIDVIDGVIEFLNDSLADQEQRRNQVQMKLNRARRLEREELQR